MTVASTEPLGASAADCVEDRVLPGGWYTLFAMLIVTMFAFINRYLLILAAQPLAATLKLSDSQLGIVQGLAFTIFTIVAVYPIAWLADRYDRRLILGACLVCWSFGTAACGFAQNFEQVLVAAIAIAAGEAALAPLITSFIPDLFKGRKRVLANGLQYFFGFVGISVALAAGGAAIGYLDRVHPQLPVSLQQFESWRLAFFAVVVPTPILLLLIASMRLRRPESVSPNAANGGTSSTLLASGSSFGKLLSEHRRAYVGVLGGLGFYTLAFGGFLIWLPLIATRLFGATPETNGYAMGLATGIGMIGGVFVSTLIPRHYLPRIGPRTPVLMAWSISLVTMPVLFVVPFASSVTMLYICFGVMMFGGTAIGVLVATMLQDMAPSFFRARFLAIWGIISLLLAGSAPTLTGFISNLLSGERGLLYALVIVAMPAWLVAAALLRFGESRFEALTRAVAAAEQQSFGITSRTVPHLTLRRRPADA